MLGAYSTELLSVAVLRVMVSMAPQEEPPGPAVLESQVCARCHSNSPGALAMRDAAGRPVGIFDLWRSTMMANSARDPLWRAAVSVERAATPSRQEEIAHECLRCHAPMADAVGLAEHGTGSVLHVLDCDGRVGDLARDGVSCTVCHGMTAAGFGEERSFTGGFVLDPQRRLFGPHQAPFAMPMMHQTGFTPTHGPHVLASAACGTCHTLVTDALDATGRALGIQHAEQTTYLEWRNSVFQDESDPGPEAASCAACHMPTVDRDGQAIRTRIARNPAGRDWPPIGPREPFGLHLLVGGNTQGLTLLREHAERLGVTAPAEAFDVSLAVTRRQLRTRTATLTVDGVRRSGGRLQFDVTLENLTGHKLPSGYPSRRLWLRTVVVDTAGAVRFESGGVDREGRLVDADGRVLPGERAGELPSPHVDRVRTAADVPIYQSILKGADGQPTHQLLRATGWWSDNRLLPRGFRGDHPDAARTAPVGTADDPDFLAGADTVHFDLSVPGDEALSVEVSLMYESIPARWIEELAAWDTAEVRALREMWSATRPGPEVLATARFDEL